MCITIKELNFNCSRIQFQNGLWCSGYSVKRGILAGCKEQGKANDKRIYSLNKELEAILKGRK